MVMSFFRPKCPVTSDERAWIDESLRWFVRQFGREPLGRPVILPTPEFFPGEYGGTDREVLEVVARMCRYMGVDPHRIAVELVADDWGAELRGDLPFLYYRRSGAAGDYEVRDGKGVIGIARTQAERAMALVATIAHELCHELLIGGGRVSSSRRDGEPLTDLLTVYLGLGIFTANAAFDFSTDHGHGWRTTHLGYLPEQMFGYALARYTLMRGDLAPTWARYLDVNPRAYLKQSLKFLESQRGS